MRPFQDALVQAKTIHRVNKTENQTILDSAYNAFDKWGRYKIVDDKDAELTAVFSRPSVDNSEDNIPQRA